jgi:hypothetical protein
MRKSMLISLTACALFLPHTDIRAADRIVTVETSVYEWSDDARFAHDTLSEPPSGRSILSRFGPFIVVDTNRAELVGSIETGTPAQFSAMMRTFPSITQIDMIDCPGTGDDEANFAIARMIRKAGITTYIPDGGSVRSGGVELFLAGVRRVADPGAEFAVHSWQDQDGLEAEDIAANDPINLEYINYYREIGMDDRKARAFYAMTNSVPHDSALYLSPRDIAAYLPLD